ncbi:hypothetical protein GCM10027048_03010 [Hymenobacter coalescens]
MKHLYCSFFLTLLTIGGARAQVGIGTTTPHDKAVLDLQSAAGDKGLLIPRMSEATRAGIAAPPQGLLVFQTDGTQPGFWYATGAGNTWLYLPDASRAGSADNLGDHTATRSLNLQGNALVGSGSSIGTAVGVGVTASGGLNIGQNTPGMNLTIGYQAGHNTAYNAAAFDNNGSYNQFVGFNSGFNNTSGSRNVYLGMATGYSNLTGSRNVIIGFNSGNANTASSNQFIGYAAGQSNTSGLANHFEGYQSGFANTTGQLNYFSGFQTGFSNQTGSNNYFSGFEAGYRAFGSNNHFAGWGTGYSTTSGTQNHFSGYRSGYNNVTGGGNHFEGYHSGQNNTTGGGNLFVGYQSGNGNVTGNSNWAFGNNAGPTVDGLVNAGAIGNFAQVSQSNSLVLGGTGSTAVRVGIGTPAPAASLEINGYTKLGSDAPSIKVKKLTATVSVNGGPTSVAHGLASTKILSVTGLVEYAPGSYVTLGYAQGAYQVNVYVDPMNINIIPQSNNSAAVYGRPVRLLVTYEE